LRFETQNLGGVPSISLTILILSFGNQVNDEIHMMLTDLVMQALTEGLADQLIRKVYPH